MKSITDRAVEAATAAATAATEKAVELAKGTSFVGENGELVPPPTAAEALMALQAYGRQVNAAQQAFTDQMAQQQQVLTDQAAQLTQQVAIINQQSQVIQQQQAILTALPQTLAQAIGTNNTQFVGPAVQSAYEAIVGGTSAQGLYTLKQIQQHIADDETGAAQLLAQQNDAVGRIAAAETTLGTHTSALSTLTTNLATKASATDLTSLSSTVATKAASADLMTLSGVVAGKALATDLNALQNTVGTKANASDLTTLATTVGTKASVADLTTLQNTVSGKASTASVQAAATTAAQGVSDAATALAEANKRLLRTGDTSTGPLGVPVASGMDKAVQKSELVGGIQRPYRVFQNVSTTPVGAYVRSGQSAPIVDGLGLGQVFAMTTVRLRTTTAPTLAATIKIFANGTEVYSTTVALTTIPGIGKTLDLLAITGASLPADITLPATLTATASAGVFEIITDGILK